MGGGMLGGGVVVADFLHAIMDTVAAAMKQAQDNGLIIDIGLLLNAILKRWPY
jgi:hypothetical protein